MRWKHAAARGKQWTPAGKTTGTCIIMVGSSNDNKQPAPTMHSTGPSFRLGVTSRLSHASNKHSANLHIAGLHDARLHLQQPDADRTISRRHTQEQKEQVEALECQFLQLNSEVSGLKEQVRSLKSQLQFKDSLLVQAQQALTASSDMHKAAGGHAVSPPTGLAPLQPSLTDGSAASSRTPNHHQATLKARTSSHRGQRTPAPAPATPPTPAILKTSPQAAPTTPTFLKPSHSPAQGSHAARKPTAAKPATPVWRAAGPGGGAFSPLHYVPR